MLRCFAKETSLEKFSLSLLYFFNMYTLEFIGTQVLEVLGKERLNTNYFFFFFLSNDVSWFFSWCFFRKMPKNFSWREVVVYFLQILMESGKKKFLRGTKTSLVWSTRLVRLEITTGRFRTKKSSERNHWTFYRRNSF